MIGMSAPVETPYRFEPCLLERIGPELADAIAELSAELERLGHRLHPRTAENLADLVRVMNCYYSNLIEGHNTTPREIERALAGELAAEEERRNLQVEAAAHIRLQREIDRRYAAGTLGEPAAYDFILWLHRDFYHDAPEAMLTGEGAGQQFRMEPGAFRSEPMHDVSVGRHVPPSSARVVDFMAHFEQRYRFAPLGKSTRIIAVAAAHHRLNFIHPFADGNGRVSRLMSHAMALEAGIGAHGLWSISRGLAHGLESRGEYKRMMDHADTPRQGDRDGRGNLSEQALQDFVLWFMRVCLDQVRFMGGLFDLDRLGERLHLYARQEGFRAEAERLLDEALVRGEVPRGQAERATGLKERTARDLLGVLVEDGILGSKTPKGPVSLRFPMKAVETLFPRLFPGA